MSMTVMGPRQRRHGSSRDQNDRRHNAHKLYVHKLHVHKVSAHSLLARKLLQARHTRLSQGPTAAKQFWLIAAVTNPAASRRVCAPPTRPRWARLSWAASANEIRRRPRYPQLRRRVVWSVVIQYRYAGCSNAGDQTVLVYRCPTTHRQVKSDIQTTTQALARLGKLKLALWCPHCASGHSIPASEAVAQNAASSEAH